MQQRSWMLHSGPTTISSSSARSTAPYQMFAAWPMVTRPTTTAVGAIQASGSTEGTKSPSDPSKPMGAPPRGSPPLRAVLAPRSRPGGGYCPVGLDQSRHNRILSRFGCADGPSRQESWRHSIQAALGPQPGRTPAVGRVANSSPHPQIGPAPERSPAARPDLPDPSDG